MGGRNPEANQLEIILADYQRLKEENAALRRLLIENRSVGQSGSITLPLSKRRCGFPCRRADRAWFEYALPAHVFFLETSWIRSLSL
jgi:hypothetical protein